MNSKIIVIALFIAALAFGIVGCENFNRYQDPYTFTCGTAMDMEDVLDDVLHAAVRHKCIPEVLTASDEMCTVRCTSVTDTNNLVVIVTLTNNPSYFSTKSITIAKYWKKYLELRGSKGKNNRVNWQEYADFEKIKNSYNNSVSTYDCLKNQQKDNTLPRDSISGRDFKKELEIAEKNREKALEEIKNFQRKHPRYPTKEEYNEWVEAFGEEIRAQLQR